MCVVTSSVLEGDDNISMEFGAQTWNNHIDMLNYVTVDPLIILPTLVTCSALSPTYVSNTSGAVSSSSQFRDVTDTFLIRTPQGHTVSQVRDVRLTTCSMDLYFNNPFTGVPYDKVCLCEVSFIFLLTQCNTMLHALDYQW